MAASELVSNIMSTGIPISHDTMQEILKQASVNGEFLLIVQFPLGNCLVSF